MRTFAIISTYFFMGDIMNICADVISRVNSDIRGKNFYTALEIEKRGEKILKLNTGNPATFGFSMPESVKNALFQKIDTALGYCDVRGMAEARNAIFEYHRSKGFYNFSIAVTRAFTLSSVVAQEVHILAYASPSLKVAPPKSKCA